MKVRQIMSDGIVTIEDTRTCHDAVEKMVRHRVRHLPVVTRQGTLCGIVTETDLLRRIVGDDACCADVGEIVVSFP